MQRIMQAPARLVRSLSTSPSRGSENALPKFNTAPSFKLTQSPNPGWKWGEGLSPESSALAKQWKEDEAQGWKSFTLKETHGKSVQLVLADRQRPLLTSSELHAGTCTCC